MRITFVFADDVICNKENADTFKAALSTAMKNLEVLFEDDLLDYRDYEYLKTDFPDSSWTSDHWVLEIQQKSNRWTCEKAGGVYVPDVLYRSYMKWYFTWWLMNERIIEII